MTELREAAQMALDALESSRVFVTSREKIKHPEGTEWYDERIEALRAALAEPVVNQQLTTEPEPVAWMHTTATGDVYFRKKPHDKVFNPQPVYTAPPQREWQGLTEAEHTQIAIDCGCASADWVFYGAAVERKLREKNNG